MSTMTKQTIQMLEMLPEEEQKTVYELLRMLVRAWDPDFTKATTIERQQMDMADKELKEGIYFTEEEVWS